MLLLTHRFMVYDDPHYESMHITYDYTYATMQPRANGNGFEWDNVFKSISLVPRVAIRFIQLTCVITPNGMTFEELYNEAMIPSYPEEKNQFRNHL